MNGNIVPKQEIRNEMKIVLPSKSCNEAVARGAVATFVSQMDPSVNELADIKTAVSEAVTNCIVHGYRDTIGNIEVLCKMISPDIFYIRIKDHGCGISDVKQAMEPLFTTRPDEERAGLGFAVMESFMDSVSVRSTEGHGTCVTMKKRILSCSVLKTGAIANERC